jgi:DNA-binding CsgD family transcriptional regulator
MRDGGEIRFTVGELDGVSVGVLSVEREPTWYPEALSPAERDVALGLYVGETYEEIATRRQTRVSTVASQVTIIFGKLGVDSTSELVAMLARGRR